MPMAHGPTACVSHDPHAQLVHALNSQLLVSLFGERGPAVPRGAGSGTLSRLLVDPNAWIINVLYVYGRKGTVPALRTSSTLHKGALFDHTTDKGAVQSIDESVPMATSICGRCAQSGRPIWLGKKELGWRSAGFAEQYYRRFSLVEVDTAGYPTPRSEISFPIADRRMGFCAPCGVLILELCGNDPVDPDVYIAELPREAINELFEDVLNIHSGYLKIAVDFLELYALQNRDDGETTRTFDHSVVDAVKFAHHSALQIFAKKNAKEIRHLIHVSRKSISRARNSYWTTHEYE